MKLAERIVMVLLVVVLFGGGIWIYYGVQKEQQEVRDAVARGDFEIRPVEPEPVETEDWRKFYPVTVPVVIGGVTVQASIADSLSERIKGLSDTPFLPDNVVKLFAFGVPGEHSIWMKDMQYSLDILWLAQDGVIVHIEEQVAPESFPESFASPIEAWFVVEAAAGFVEKNGIEKGDKVTLPTASTPSESL